MCLPILGQGNRKLSADRNLGTFCMLPTCDVMLMEIVVFILGVAIHTFFLQHTVYQILSRLRVILLIYVFFFYSHNPLNPVLSSCYLLLLYKIQHLFSSLNVVQWYSSFIAERSQTCSQRTVFTLFSKNSDGCNICIPFLGFEGTIYSVSSLLFWSGAWKTKIEIWTMSLLHGNIMCVTVRPSTSPPKGGFITVVSMLHDKHSSSSSCSPASYSPDSKIEK